MRRLSYLFFSICLLLGVSAGSATELKIGVVNTARILNEAPQVKSARERLQAEFAEREQALSRTRDELKAKEEKLQRDSAIMSDEERRQLEHELVNGKRDFLRAQNEFREDLNIRQNEIFSKVQFEIQQVIQQLARELQYDLILENFVFASSRVDVTNLVLQRLNQSSTKGKSSSSQGK